MWLCHIRESEMAEEPKGSKELSSGMVIGIGIVVFVVIVAIWYLVIK